MNSRTDRGVAPLHLVGSTRPYEADRSMPDDLKNRGVHDRTRIHLEEKHEVMYWTKKLGIDEATLKAAVEAAGPTIGAIRQHLLDQGYHTR